MVCTAVPVTERPSQTWKWSPTRNTNTTTHKAAFLFFLHSWYCTEYMRSIKKANAKANVVSRVLLYCRRRAGSTDTKPKHGKINNPYFSVELPLRSHLRCDAKQPPCFLYIPGTTSECVREHSDNQKKRNQSVWFQVPKLTPATCWPKLSLSVLLDCKWTILTDRGRCPLWKWVFFKTCVYQFLGLNI